MPGVTCAATVNCAMMTPIILLNNAADVKVRRYREAYTAPDRLLAFLPSIMSTSGRIHGEFLRLHILSHRQTVNFFELLGEEY